MAGSRILPVALATIAGISIGIATFEGEFKEQRKKRLEEEYKRDVAAVSALNSEGPSPMASSTVKPPAPEQLPSRTETAKTSKLSSLLGTWAWSKPEGVTTAATKKPSTDETPPQPKP